MFNKKKGENKMVKVTFKTNSTNYAFVSDKKYALSDCHNQFDKIKKLNHISDDYVKAVIVNKYPYSIKMKYGEFVKQMVVQISERA
jgi:hypothetical protein